MNSNLLSHSTVSANRASPRTAISLPREKTRTVSSASVVDRPAVIAVKAPEKVVAAAKGAPEPNRRQMIFRCVRLTLAGVLVSCAAIYARTAFTTARSEQAYINAEIVALRAPIAGLVKFDAIGSGKMIRAGAPLFTIENVRFGNEQAMAQLNWAAETAERLRAESDEAAITLRHREEVTRLHEKMFAEQVIPRMQLIEEQAKRDLANAVLSNKLAQAQKAAERVAELTKQVHLQQTAAVTMPFDGIAWTVPAKSGAQLAVNEPVVEVINPKEMWVDAYFAERQAARLKVGAEVNVETPRGEMLGRGTVESVRAGVGRIPFERVAAISPTEYVTQRVAVRVRLHAVAPFEASEFFGVGRSVVVTLNTQQ